jgi:hypothetical protein
MIFADALELGLRQFDAPQLMLDPRLLRSGDSSHRPTLILLQQ